MIGALGGMVITLPCYSMAHQAINRITGLSPEFFPYSTSFLAIGYALPVILTVGALILGVYSFWQVLVLAWSGMRVHIGMFTVLFSGELPKVDKGRELLHSSRVIAAVTLMGVSSYHPNKPFTLSIVGSSVYPFSQIPVNNRGQPQQHHKRRVPRSIKDITGHE